MIFLFTSTIANDTDFAWTFQTGKLRKKSTHAAEKSRTSLVRQNTYWMHPLGNNVFQQTSLLAFLQHTYQVATPTVGCWRWQLPFLCAAELTEVLQASLHSLRSVCNWYLQKIPAPCILGLCLSESTAHLFIKLLCWTVCLQFTRSFRIAAVGP